MRMGRGCYKLGECWQRFINEIRLLFYCWEVGLQSRWRLAYFGHLSGGEGGELWGVSKYDCGVFLK